MLLLKFRYSIITTSSFSHHPCYQSHVIARHGRRQWITFSQVLWWWHPWQDPQPLGETSMHQKYHCARCLQSCSEAIFWNPITGPVFVSSPIHPLCQAVAILARFFASRHTTHIYGQPRRLGTKSLLFPMPLLVSIPDMNSLTPPCDRPHEAQTFINPITSHHPHTSNFDIILFNKYRPLIHQTNKAHRIYNLPTVNSASQSTQLRLAYLKVRSL